MNSYNDLSTSVPGNGSRTTRQVRPLRTEYASPEAETSDLVQAENRIEALRLLVLAVLREVDSLKRVVASRAAKRRDIVNLDNEVEAYEASLIREALIKCNGNQRDAAKLLRIKPSTLNAKMKRLGITVETGTRRVD
jgi:DNA-binding NtrC family response regulator